MTEMGALVTEWPRGLKETSSMHFGGWNTPSKQLIKSVLFLHILIDGSLQYYFPFLLIE